MPIIPINKPAIIEFRFTVLWQNNGCDDEELGKNFFPTAIIVVYLSLCLAHVLEYHYNKI